MPSHMPSSFASAAAGQASSRDSRSGRGDGRSGDWAQREARAPNGMRPLGPRTSFSQPTQRDPTLPTPGSETGSVQQPSQNSDQSANFRISKNQMLDIFRAQQDSGSIKRDVSHLFESNWAPGHSNGTNGRSGWGKSTDGRESHGPDVCWDEDGSVLPIGLEEMSEQEQAHFSSDVNSPLKPPPQNSNKDPNASGANGRKTSVSHGPGSGGYGLSSPVSSRPSTRRQQTSDSITGLASPSTSRFSREESSHLFTRKLTESKDGQEDRPEETKSVLPFGGLMRSNTAGSALGNGPVSPWGPTPASSTTGTFGKFTLGTPVNPPTPIDTRPPFRGESRLAHLMQKDSSEDMSSKTVDRPWRPRQRTDTDPFGEDPPTGSAALGGGQDISPPLNSQRRAPGLDTPIRGASSEFGMSGMRGFRDAGEGEQIQQTPQAYHGREPLSPSDTNPYHSPPSDNHDADDASYDDEPPLHGRGQGLGGIPENMGTLARGFQNAPFDGSDRSQTSSAGVAKVYPPLGGLSSLGGLGSMGGWPTGGNALGTPDRENRPAFPTSFPNSLFGIGDLQSPGIGGLGMFGQGTNLPPSGTAGRGSKLGSLFPPQMQAEMQGNANENSADAGEARQSGTFGAIGRNPFPPSRDTDSPMRAGRQAFEDMFQQTDTSRNQGPFSSSDSAQAQTATAFTQAPSAQNNYQQSQGSSDSTSNQLPTVQQRMMVMPDRMRWEYLDPQGRVQGPWSGLEMHDWYKAQFFSADLSVKKVEDAEFEPLGQLIRRIGNSREPFLVPQIGIPHGAPSQAGASFTPAAAGPGTGAQPGSVQPPFAGAFPSFGTTLTAEQQNALEHRKQEEQFLMARQREFLAQQQLNMRQTQMTGHPSALHHHSSAHSLQSQPSFGSMTSPIGAGMAQPPIPGVPGFFDAPPRQIPNQLAGGMQSDYFREDDFSRLTLQERIGGSTSGPQQPTHAQQIAAIFGQHPEAQQQAARMEQIDPQGYNRRLQEFHQLTSPLVPEGFDHPTQAGPNVPSEPIGPPQQYQPQHQMRQPSPEQRAEGDVEPEEQEVLSLTQQVQKAASAKQSPISASQPESPWAKVNTGLPMPFPPPPQSTTPLPAPTAQRGRSNLPEALTVEARSRSETPEVAATPSIAPWAKEAAEAAKKPSLKEIQEAEAKKAAEAEEHAAAVRRANYEQELKILASQPTAPAPGLPTSSTWGSVGSPATPTNAPSAWAKPAVSKTQAATSFANTKKLSDILREEQLQKQRAAAAAAASHPSASVSGGKRYADLASKPMASVPPTSGSPWSTVGAGGKVKIPTGPAATAPQAVRSASGITAATVSGVRAARPAPTARSVTTIGLTDVNAANEHVRAANEQLTRWAKAELSKGVKKDIDVDGVVKMLSEFPPPLEAATISDVAYNSSETIDGKRFAEEYLRRRKLAEKGVIEPANSSASGDKSGGWNEVAKKGPPKEEPAGYKIASKKKGKK